MGVNVIRPRRLSAREVLSVRLEPELREALDHEAARRGLTRSDLIRQALTASSIKTFSARPQHGSRAAIRRGMKVDEDRLATAPRRWRKGAAAAWPGQPCRCPDRTCPRLVRPRRRPQPVHDRAGGRLHSPCQQLLSDERSATRESLLQSAGRRPLGSPLRRRAARRQDDKSDRGTPAAEHSRLGDEEVRGRRRLLSPSRGLRN